MLGEILFCMNERYHAVFLFRPSLAHPPPLGGGEGWEESPNIELYEFEVGGAGLGYRIEILFCMNVARKV